MANYRNVYKQIFTDIFMGTALVKMKIMPENPEVDLEVIKAKVSELLKEKVDSEVTYEEEPVAFGLIAVIAGFALDESKEIYPIQAKIDEIENVKSAEVSDFRRAFG